MTSIQDLIERLNVEILWISNDYRYLKKENWNNFSFLIKEAKKNKSEFTYLDHEKWQIKEGELTPLLKDLLTELKNLEEEKICLVKNMEYESAALLRNFKAEYVIEIDKAFAEYYFKNKNIFNKINDRTIGFLMNGNPIINHNLIKTLNSVY